MNHPIASKQHFDEYPVIFNSIEEGISIIEKVEKRHKERIDYKYVFTNPAFEGMTGLSSIIGKTMLDVLPGVNDSTMQVYDNIIKTGQPEKFETYEKTLGQWFSVYAFPIGEPELKRIAVILNDISAIKKSELILRESEARKEFLLKLSDAICTLADPVQIQLTACSVLGEHIGASRVLYGDVVDGKEVIIKSDYANGIPSIAARFNVADFSQFAFSSHISGRMVIINDVSTDPRLNEEERSAFKSIGAAAAISLGLMKNGKWVAAFGVHHNKPRNWSPLEISLMEETAERTWVAVESARAEAEREKLLSQVYDEGERLWAIIRSIDDEVWISDDAGNITLLNPPDQRAHGLQSNDQPTLETADALETLEPDGTPRLKENAPLLRSLKGETVCGEEIVRHLNTGRLRCRWYNCTPIRDQSGNITGAVSVCRDITKAKRDDAALRESEEWKAFLQKLNDVLRPLSDPDEIQGAVTRFAMDYFHADRCYYSEIDNESAIVRRDASRSGLPPVAGVYPIDNFLVRKPLIDAGWPFTVEDVHTSEMVDEEFRQRYIQLNIISYLDVPLVKNGKTVGTFCVAQSTPRSWTESETELAQEIAECTWATVERAKSLKALRESENHARALVKELEEADKNKNQFISILSHELRNPLAAITVGLSVLDVLGDKQQAESIIEIINRQVSQLCKLVDELLDLTRISQNKIKLKKESILLNETVWHAVEDIKPGFLQKGVMIDATIQPQPLYLFADPVRVDQCIGNLLHNALKFTPANGNVRVTLRQEKNEAVIIVQDSGIGISPGKLEDLFQPFTQADEPLESYENSGLGLGLSIVKGIVAMHNGNITAKSEGVGKGSLFTIRLPVSMDSVQTLGHTAVRKVKGALRILIIEDNKDLAEVLCSLAGILGHEAYAVMNGTEGIAKARELQPDVIFCDIGLPGKNGYEVARIIREDTKLNNLLLIALTGFAGEYDIVKAKESGFDIHLAKPINMDDLKKVLGEDFEREQ